MKGRTKKESKGCVKSKFGMYLLERGSITFSGSGEEKDGFRTAGYSATFYENEMSHLLLRSVREPTGNL